MDRVTVEEVEIWTGNRFYVVVPCPELEHPDIELEDGEMFAVLRPVEEKAKE